MFLSPYAAKQPICLFIIIDFSDLYHPSRMIEGLSNAEIQTENRTKNGAVKCPLTRAQISKGLDTERASGPLLMKQVLHLGNHVQMDELFGKLTPKQEIQYSSLIKSGVLRLKPML